MWKDIKGWEPYYEVSDSGDVRNKITGKLITGDKNSTGYYRVCLYNTKNTPVKQRFFRHRLVAACFIPNLTNLPEVNHKDTNLANNTVENLEWVNKKTNELHSRMYGTKEYKPFSVTLKDGTTSTYDAKQDLASAINVSKTLVQHWLHRESRTFTNYGIENIEYI